MTFNDDECYLLFIAIDNRARALGGANQEVNDLREKLLPVYRAWHDEHPFDVHPSVATTGRPT